jgi:hypothetical protein
MKWYLEFNGPEPMDEIGVVVDDAPDPDTAIELARAQVLADYKARPDDEKMMLFETPYDATLFSTQAWVVYQIVPWPPRGHTS